MGTTYCEIRVKSHLGPSSAAAFPDFDTRHVPNGETILTGPLVDQPALHGLLMQIRDLGLVLVEVRCFEVEASSP